MHFSQLASSAFFVISNYEVCIWFSVQNKFHRCVRQDKCGTKPSLLGPRSGALFDDKDLLSELVAQAESATCDNQAETCCHKDDVKPEPRIPIEGKKCSEIEGHR